METLVIQVGVNSRGQPQRDQRRIAGSVLHIGRASGCELQLPDPRVALDHALITITASGTSIAAIGGALKVNGKAASQSALVVGDCVEIGPYRLRVEAAPTGLPLALAVSLEMPPPPSCGEQIRSDESRVTRQSRRRLSYLGLLGLLLLCLLLPVAPDLLGYARLSSPTANAIAQAATAETSVTAAGLAASAGATARLLTGAEPGLPESMLRTAATRSSRQTAGSATRHRSCRCAMRPVRRATRTSTTTSRKVSSPERSAKPSRTHAAPTAIKTTRAHTPRFVHKTSASSATATSSAWPRGPPRPGSPTF
jgi:hypothetical protein